MAVYAKSFWVPSPNLAPNIITEYTVVLSYGVASGDLTTLYNFTRLVFGLVAKVRLYGHFDTSNKREGVSIV